MFKILLDGKIAEITWIDINVNILLLQQFLLCQQQYF